MKELEYEDLSPKAKKGIKKFGELSSNQMGTYFKKFEKKTGQSATNICNKEKFYSFMAATKPRRKR